jgi:hypothetical protein
MNSLDKLKMISKEMVLINPSIIVTNISHQFQMAGSIVDISHGGRFLPGLENRDYDRRDPLH